MRKMFFYALLVLLTFCSCQKKISTSNETTQLSNDNSPQRVTKLVAADIIDKNATTFFLVRHAEKEKDMKDPVLSKNGEKRALVLANLLVSIDFASYYSTDFRRTKKTASYVAAIQYREQDLKIYDHRDLEGAAKEMLVNNSKEPILVSGHSNTTPQMLNILTGTNDWKSLSEDDYDNLYIVSVYENAPAKVLHYKYGEPNE